MIRLLQSKWIVAVIGIISYVVTTAMIWRPPPASAPATTPSSPTGDEVAVASWRMRNPEAEQLIAELRQQKEALDKKEQQLSELSLRLQNERAEIIAVTQSVTRLQREFDRNVIRVKEEETANLKKLAKVYAAMAPEAAAAILKELPEEQAVKVIMFMKEAESAPILETLAKTGDGEAKRVAALSERMRLALTRTPAPRTASP
jgi:flagellar motility protein MotE (MotC chaperone)